MQALYAIRAEEGKAPLGTGEAKRLLTKHFDQTISLFTWLIYVLVETARYAETDAHQKSAKHVPTELDLAVPTKIAGNELLWKIIESNYYKEAVETFKPTMVENDDWIKKLYNQLYASPAYAVYNAEQARDKKSEKEILEYIFTDLMLANEDFTDSAEYQYNNWDDDSEMVRLLVLQFLQKPNSFKLHEMISAEKRDFANLLLATTEARKEQLQEIIKPKLKNWDVERIALLDMIVMEMGTCEFLYFETIPVKVTINEYIDIAKAYSTPQSGQFVNGILDNIKKELETNNQLNKVAYKKS
jgi:transcription antitermination protein NusB